MADFTQAAAHTLKLEGGYQNQASDRGNYYQGVLIGTNHGIAAETLAAWLKRTPTVADMKALTVATAQAIYRQNYWVPIQGDLIGNQSVAELLFDFAIASGQETAIQHTQRLLAGLGRPVQVDGLMGPLTLAALNAVPQQALFDALKADRKTLFEYLAAGDANYALWLNTWLSRLDDFVFRVPAPVLRRAAAGCS